MENKNIEIYCENKPLQITKRGVVYITKMCNVKCCFCYYKYGDNLGHTPFDNIKRILEKFKKEYNIEYVDITGGEPTIHPQIIEIIKSSLEYGIKPTVITNAQKTKTISKLIDNGLEDILVSIQGLGSKHDEAVNKKGAFNKVMETLLILKDRGFGFRTNTVLTNYSCPDIEAMAELFIELSPRIVNLISFNPYEGSLWKDRNNNEFQLSYTLQAKATRKAIDILSYAGIWVNVRYIPFCFMKGCEKHVCNFLQLQYDPYEWEYTASNGLSADQISNLTDKAVTSCSFGTDKKEKFYYFAMQRIIKNNKTVAACRECSNINICDHIYSQYINEFGENEYVPFKGEVLKDTMHYRKTDRRWGILKG
jgi:MoaA/NifB/PqqE/SkfB family radical SAM enzyme